VCQTRLKLSWEVDECKPLPITSMGTATAAPDACVAGSVHGTRLGVSTASPKRRNQCHTRHRRQFGHFTETTALNMVTSPKAPLGTEPEVWLVNQNDGGQYWSAVF
jgi:hypothetical protein